MFTVCAVYRPPSSPPEFLTLLSDYMTATNLGKIIIAGDFNLPSINWTDDHTFQTLDNPLLDMMMACDLEQVVQDVTRLSGDGGTILDLVFISKATFQYEVSVEEGISDHKLIFISCSVNKCSNTAKPKAKVVNDFARADDQAILDELRAFAHNMSNENPVSLWLEFKKIVLECIRMYVPCRRIETNRASPWVDRNIIHLKRRLKRAKKYKIAQI